MPDMSHKMILYIKNHASKAFRSYYTFGAIWISKNVYSIDPWSRSLTWQTWASRLSDSAASDPDLAYWNPTDRSWSASIRRQLHRRRPRWPRPNRSQASSCSLQGGHWNWFIFKRYKRGRPSLFLYIFDFSNKNYNSYIKYMWNNVMTIQYTALGF